ncbi:NAD(P)/FAD-dependent oxidoreductase [Halanaerobium hydrogeniformans]|uniref:FAD-dependent pyridine nucleotide-disulfide oxidoreductase n=1 Tax=Halanaerobium hydrogeniformans TaxID=656519 RepID=E4RL64_HALHG|nr:FAD-dependent oxidoreductase [Halanaerobium hydrogeniformans]ADQ14828.1 FAD-dependent pyridine nucleotide-disulfide oxidoreductase [Halanaerobium hydrogeniformans]
MDYLIVGAGAAGVSAAKEILKNKNDDDQISIFTDEAYPFYYRPRLIECLSGEVEVEDIIIHDQKWFRDRGISLHLEEKIVEIDSSNKVIKSEKASYKYDKLLLANGSHPFVPPFSGVELDNIFTLKNAEDLKNINQAAKKAKTAVVVGGGLLGLEIAYNLAKAGLKTTVLEVAPYLLPMQLDKKAGKLLKQKIENENLDVICSAKTVGFAGLNKVNKLILENDQLSCDIALISTGIRSNISLAEDSDLEINRGIKVDKQMQSCEKDIFAAGDIAEHNDKIYGIWPPSIQQGQVAGAVMSGQETSFEGYIPTHKLKVAGINVVSIGELNKEGDYQSEVLLDDDSYVKVIKDGDSKIGAIIVGHYEAENELLAEIKR